MNQNTTQHHSQHRTASKFMGSRICQKNRQKIEGGICHKVDHLIGAAGVAHQFRGYQDGQHSLQHTSRCQRRQDRSKNTSDQVKKFLIPFHVVVCISLFLSALQVQCLRKRKIHIRHIASHNDLVLTAFGHHAGNSGKTLNRLCVCLRLVLQIKT